MKTVSSGLAGGPELVTLQLSAVFSSVTLQIILMTATESVSLFGEILPRLGCVNLVVAGGCLEEVKVSGSWLSVGRQVFQVPGRQFEEEISGLSRTEQCLTFRLKLLGCDKLPGIISPQEELHTFTKFSFSPPALELNVDYDLLCQCGAKVGSVRPARVLPLPSVSWKSNSLDWQVSFSQL